MSERCIAESCLGRSSAAFWKMPAEFVCQIPEEARPLQKRVEIMNTDWSGNLWTCLSARKRGLHLGQVRDWRSTMFFLPRERAGKKELKKERDRWNERWTCSCVFPLNPGVLHHQRVRQHVRIHQLGNDETNTAVSFSKLISKKTLSLIKLEKFWSSVFLASLVKVLGRRAHTPKSRWWLKSYDSLSTLSFISRVIRAHKSRSSRNYRFSCVRGIAHKFCAN